MPNTPMSHVEALKLVCAVCTNLHGKKAVIEVTEVHMKLIRKFVFAGYQRHSIWLPQGLCTRCSFDLHTLEKGEQVEKEVQHKLEQDILEQEIQVEEIPQEERQERRRSKDVGRIKSICGDCGKGLLLNQKTHSCDVSDITKMLNMVDNIPVELRGKLALHLIQEQRVSAVGDSDVTLPPAQGGVPVQVHLGPTAAPPTPPPFTMDEVATMAARAHLEGEQTERVFADIRVKLGKNMVQPGLKKTIPLRNKRFAQ